MSFKLRSTGANYKEICLICISLVFQCGEKKENMELLKADEGLCMAVVYRKRKMRK